MSQPSGFRLSPQQLRLWSHLAVGPAEAYRTRCVLTLEGELDAPRIEQALRDVLSRHESLRTVYRRLPGTSAAVQAPGDVPPTVLAHHDWSGLSEPEQTFRIDALLEGQPGGLAALETLPVFHLAALGPRRHVLVIDLPALSADGRTFGILAREIGQAYAARGQGSALPTADVQYADVAEVFHQLLESDDTESGRRHWMERDFSAALSATLPSARPAPRERGFQPRLARLSLAPELVSAVEAASGRTGVPVATFLLACWQLLLARLSGRSEWSVAVSYDGRTYEGLDEAPGLFERYLPLNVEPREHARFVDFVQDVGRAVKATVEWQEYFDASRSLKAPGPDGQPPYFPFAFEDISWPQESREGGLTITVARMDARTERFDLKLSCVRKAGALELQVHHDAELYTPQESARLLDRLATLLQEATAAPERTVDALSVVSEAELRQLEGFNRTERPSPPDRCIHELFDEQAHRTPEATAVVFEAQRLTFAELAARANQLAHHLRGLGVGPEVRVGLLLERSVETMVGLLGILKAGGAYVPLDPMYPRERLAYILKQAEVPFLVTRSELGSLLPEGVTRLVRLDGDAEALAREPATAPRTPVSPDNLAYVLFTSGSTGRPKGVMIQHRSVINLAAALQQAVYAGRGPGLRVSVNAPLVFDASVKQWIQLLHGHTLHIIPEEVRPDAARLCEYVRQHGLDVLDCTPSLLVPMLARGLGREPGISPALVLVGGEAIDGRTWAELARSERTRFVNVYGPTECTVDSTACAASEAQEPTIGGPLANMRVHLLDRHLHPVPIGATGELFIGGAGVGRGYAGQPAMTAERFIPDPFGASGARLYRTGDLGRWREDGRLEFLGRADHQVKIRGFRIELGEIEALLQTHPSVGETVVVVRETAPGEQHLVGYFVPRGGPSAGAQGHELATQLRGFLREMVPEYMVPWALVALERMPLNRNGKLDRGALPDPRTVMAETTPYEAPTTTVEQTIADIWREALKVPRVGLQSNFFDLGGHSILMVQVHEKLSAAFGRQFSMVELFQHPTVAALARHIQASQQEKADDSTGTREAHDERARKQRQAMQQQALRIKAGRGKR